MVVIGSNWGDEGKGATVNLLCEYHSHLKRGIRFNGGPQSSHTVILPSRQRHAFSSVSSAYANYLEVGFTPEVLIEPMAFAKELRELVFTHGIDSPIFLSPQQFLITPYDMAVNQIKERSRRKSPKGPNGSCGFGIHETALRGEKGEGLTLEDVVNGSTLIDSTGLRKHFEEIFAYHLSGLSKLDFVDRAAFEKFQKLGTKPAMDTFISLWYEAFTFLFDNGVSVEKNPYSAGAAAIYEGGQGLLLDRSREEYFPHVTHSYTGLINVVYHANLSDRLVGEVFFVTRPYATRHGAGPMGGAGSTGADATPLPEHQSFYNVQDPTNIPNEFQGAIRLGAIDWSRLKARILEEMKVYFHCPEAAYATPVLALTCMDQVAYPDHAHFALPVQDPKSPNAIELVLPAEFPSKLAAFLGFPVALICGNKDLTALRKVVPSASGLITMYYPDGTCKERDIT